MNALTIRLGWTLLHFLWQGAAVAALLAVALMLLRRRSAGVRYATGCAALVLMAAAPMVTFVLLRAPEPVKELAPASPSAVVWQTPPAVELPSGFAARQTPAAGELPQPFPRQPVQLPQADGPVDAAPAPVAAQQVEPAASWEQRLRPALPWAVGLWLAGVAALSLWHLVGWIGVQRLRRAHTRPVAEPWQHTLARLAKSLRVSRPVRLVESALVEVPTALGFLRPMILLPASALSGLPVQQLEAILAHELAHIRRWDYLVNLLQVLAETLLFYHPAVWWVSRRIRIEREHCCDDLAVSVCRDPLTYARALATMEELRPVGSRLAMAASGGQLLPRIKRVLALPNGSERTMRAWAGPAALVAVILLAVGLPLGMRTSGPPAKAEQPATPSTQPAGKHLLSWRYVLRTREQLPGQAEPVEKTWSGPWVHEVFEAGKPFASAAALSDRSVLRLRLTPGTGGDPNDFAEMQCQWDGSSPGDYLPNWEKLRGMGASAKLARTGTQRPYRFGSTAQSPEERVAWVESFEHHNAANGYSGEILLGLAGGVDLGPPPATGPVANPTAPRWQDGRGPKEPLGTWQDELARANRMRDLDLYPFLRSYQRVLDAHPPRDVEQMVRVEMGVAMRSFLDRSAEKEAIPWLAEIVTKFPDLAWRRSGLVARNHLAELLMTNYQGKYQPLVEALLGSIARMPGEWIEFDGSLDQYNLPNIAAAQAWTESAPAPVAPFGAGLPKVDPQQPPELKAMLDQMRAQADERYRQELLKERQKQIDLLHNSAADELAGYHKWASDPARRKIIDDPFQDPAYQRRVDGMLAEVAKLLAEPPRGPASRPATASASAAARREVNVVTKISLEDKDDAPAGLYAGVPLYPVDDQPLPSWIYQRAAAAHKAREGPFRPPFELIGRLEGSYAPKGTLEVAEQYIEGDTITIRLCYIDEDKEIVTHNGPPFVGVYGKTPTWSVYIWGQKMPDLPPGKYQVVLELVEYLRQGDKLIVAPKFDVRRFEHLTTTFTVPGPATAPATGPSLPGGADLDRLKERAISLSAAVLEPAEAPLTEDLPDGSRVVSAQRFRVVQVLAGNNLPGEIKLTYHCLPGQRPVGLIGPKEQAGPDAKGERAVWILGEQAFETFWGAKALADTQENRAAAVDFVKAAKRPEKYAPGAPVFLPGSRISLAEALKDDAIVAVCEAVEAGFGRVTELGGENVSQKVKVLEVLAGGAQVGAEVMVRYARYTGGTEAERPVYKGERTLNIAAPGNGGRGVIWDGRKVLADSPGNRALLAGLGKGAAAQPATAPAMPGTLGAPTTQPTAELTDPERKAMETCIDTWLGERAQKGVARSNLDIAITAPKGFSTTRTHSTVAQKDIDVLVLPIEITNRSAVPVKAAIAQEWYGGEWPPTDLYACVLAPEQPRPQLTPIFLAGEKGEITPTTVIEPGKSISLLPRMDWPGTGSVHGWPIVQRAGTYTLKVLLVVEAEGKRQVIESEPIVLAYPPPGEPATAEQAFLQVVGRINAMEKDHPVFQGISKLQPTLDKTTGEMTSARLHFQTNAAQDPKGAAHAADPAKPFCDLTISLFKRPAEGQWQPTATARPWDIAGRPWIFDINLYTDDAGLKAKVDALLNEPRPPATMPATTQAAGKGYPSAEEAALEAPDEDGNPFRHMVEIDRAATLKLLAAKENRELLDLNGDGQNEAIIDRGVYVARDGSRGDENGAHNRERVIVARGPDGLWRPVLVYGGSLCAPAASSTNGWRDIVTCWHVGGMYPVGICRFDGARYVGAGGAEWIGDSTLSTIMHVPDDIAALVAQRKLGRAAGVVKVVKGIAFEGPLASDGGKAQEVLLAVIDVLEADGQKLELTKLSRSPTCSFLFVKTDKGWTFAAEAPAGRIDAPLYDSRHNTFTLVTQTGGDDHPARHEWSFRDGLPLNAPATAPAATQSAEPKVSVRFEPPADVRECSIVDQITATIETDRPIVPISLTVQKPADASPYWDKLVRPADMVEQDYLKELLVMEQRAPRPDEVRGVGRLVAGGVPLRWPARWRVPVMAGGKLTFKVTLEYAVPTDQQLAELSCVWNRERRTEALKSLDALTAALAKRREVGFYLDARGAAGGGGPTPAAVKKAEFVMEIDVAERSPSFEEAAKAQGARPVWISDGAWVFAENGGSVLVRDGKKDSYPAIDPGFLMCVDPDAMIQNVPIANEVEELVRAKLPGSDIGGNQGGPYMRLPKAIRGRELLEFSRRLEGTGLRLAGFDDYGRFQIAGKAER